MKWTNSEKQTTKIQSRIKEETGNLNAHRVFK